MLLPFLTSVRRACATRLRYALRILTLQLGTSVTVARIVSSIRYSLRTNASLTSIGLRLLSIALSS